MEGLPKDVLCYKVCAHLSLRDIYSLARISKYFLAATRVCLHSVQEMYKKWHPERCYLEALRRRDEKCMEHFSAYNKIPKIDGFLLCCQNDDLENLQKMPLDSYEDRDAPMGASLIYFAPAHGNARDGVRFDKIEIVEGLIYAIIHGSWKCFDYLGPLYPKELERIIETGFYVGVEPTLRHKSDLVPYISACCKRKLYQMPMFVELITLKCLEVDHYDMLAAMKFTIRGMSTVYDFLIFCDDPRFKEFYECVEEHYIVEVINHPETEGDTLGTCTVGRVRFGNRELQLGFEEFKKMFEEERPEVLQFKPSSSEEDSSFCVLH